MTVPEDIARVVEARYGLGRVDVHERLAGGHANDLFLVDADGRRLVLRVVRSPVHVAGLEWETHVTRTLAAAVPEVVAPLPTVDGGSFVTIGADAVVVLPYADAAPADRDDPRHCEAAAELLGRFHAAAGELDARQRPGAVRLAELRAALADGSYLAAIGPTARPWPPELEHRSDEIDAGRAWLLSLVESLARDRRPPEGVVHGDYFRGNVLCSRTEVVALVDFEETRVDWVADDLAGAVWEFCKADEYETFDATKAAAFVRSYREAGGTSPPGDDDLIVPLIRARRILELLRAPYDREVDWDYQRANLDAFQRLG